ncbi:MAG: hypothetical protein M4D80_30880 [Myxococcota bacterium]|nr:hypothetical protein [Myxococcota bacterium]
MKRLAFAFMLLAAACSSKKSENTTPTGGGSTVTAATGVALELGEMKLVDVGKNKALLIHANGEIEYEGAVGARVTKQGTIVNDKGEVGFTLLADGSIKGPDGKVIDVTLSNEGVIKVGDKTISIDADGSLKGANPEAPQMKIEGATTPGLRRTAMFVLVALTTPEEAPPPTSAPAPGK